MDFAMLPPEINSGRMYSGAGAGPMLAAASAWDGLAAELQTVAMAYESMIAELDNGWSGPSATAMTAAATPYAQWMRTTSAQAERTANQARTAAAAYETAFAMTVPPPVVAANRAQLTSLLATNFLGQNIPAIAATEAHYAQMWAQDAAAMYNYAGSSAAAARLTPFTQPPQTTNPAGTANQAAAAGQAAATSASSHANTITSALTQSLQGLTSPAAATASPTAASLLASLAPAAALDPGMAASFAGLASSLFGSFVIDSAGTFGVDVAGSFGIDLIGVGEIGEEFFPIGAGLATSVAPVSAGLGEAASVGALSVPPAWTMAAPSVIQQVGTALPGSGAAVASAVAAGETTIPVAEMATAGLAGRATAAVGRGRRDRPGTTTRPRPAPPQPPEQPQRPAAHGPITRIAGELRELADLRDAGILTEAEFTEEKQRLLGR